MSVIVDDLVEPMAVSWLSLQGPWRATAVDRRLMLSRALVEGVTSCKVVAPGVDPARAAEEDGRGPVGRRAPGRREVVSGGESPRCDGPERHCRSAGDDIDLMVGTPVPTWCRADFEHRPRVRRKLSAVLLTQADTHNAMQRRASP